MFISYSIVVIYNSVTPSRQSNVNQKMLFIVLFAQHDWHTEKLNARVRVHKRQIKDPSDRYTPCCEHFAEYGRRKF